MNGLSGEEIVRVQRASAALSQIPAGADPNKLLDALRQCLRLGGALVSVVDPLRLHAMSCQGIGLPLELVTGYVGMNKTMQQLAHRPLFLSKPGSLWIEDDDRALPVSVRERMDVLRQRRTLGFGQGAGYKVRERWRPWGSEHVLLALLANEGEDIAPATGAMLAALNHEIFGTIERMRLPLVHWEPLGWQIRREETLGYIMVSSSGALLATNRQACELVERYSQVAGLVKGPGLLGDFIHFAMAAMQGRGEFVLRHEDRMGLLEVFGHSWSQTGYAISEEATLIVLREERPPMRVREILEALPNRLREIAILLGTTDVAYKDIARNPGKLGAIRKQVERVYRAFGVHSREQLMLLFRR